MTRLWSVSEMNTRSCSPSVETLPAKQSIQDFRCCHLNVHRDQTQCFAWSDSQRIQMLWNLMWISAGINEDWKIFCNPLDLSRIFSYTKEPCTSSAYWLAASINSMQHRRIMLLHVTWVAQQCLKAMAAKLGIFYKPCVLGVGLCFLCGA